MDIQKIADASGFELLCDGEQVGKIMWKQAGDVMIMNGTIIDESLRGQNMGEALLDKAVDYAREHHYKMQAVCPYVVKMFDRSSKYDDVKQ